MESPELDSFGNPVMKKGKPVADPSKRDTESIPLTEEIQEYIDHQIRICEDIFVARYAIQGLCIFQKKPYDEFS